MEQMTDDQKQAALDALRFQEDPTCKRVLVNMSNQYRFLIEDSDFTDQQLREDCYRQLRAIKDFQKQLKVLADRGKVILERSSRTT